MVNSGVPVNVRVNEEQLLKALEGVLLKVPMVAGLERHEDVETNDRRLDAVLDLRFKSGPAQRWVVELKRLPLEPKVASYLGLLLPELVEKGAGDYTVVVAPYVSPRSGEILTRQGVGYCDLSGNCRLASGPLYVERSGAPNAFARRSSQGSLFTPGSERVLRALLDPKNQARSWSVRDLAEAAWPGVSVGQAHKVAKRLEGEAFLQRVEGKLVPVEPDKLLQAWVAGYRARRNREERFYSPLDLGELRDRAGALMAPRGKRAVPGAMASFSAAEVLAPAVRQHRLFIYWRGDRTKLIRGLELKPVTSGENVVVLEPYDEGVFYPFAAAPVPVTGPVQTYLDLRASPARGEEAAAAVFEKWLRKAYAR
jgi:Transcriptional regulator, AbiEi antitoxin, Type IV TA system